jgi:hypothetical protein
MLVLGGDKLRRATSRDGVIKSCSRGICDLNNKTIPDKDPKVRVGGKRSLKLPGRNGCLIRSA